jgi:N-acetylmuramoyl-L-alanine amidase
MWKHKDFTFYEGVYNRVIAKKLAKKLLNADIAHVVVHDAVKDKPLTDRTNLVNSFSEREDYKCVLFSIHGNAAANLSANYFSVWTSPGQTESDKIATILYKELQQEFPNERFSADNTDGDCDWEARFAMVTKTFCPAVLSENGFFTNEVQARKMLTDEWTEKVAQAHFNTILKLL